MNNENGRSMVEMLGVLAIIGVLSVAGIAGYSMAMKRYRANEIVNIASTLYTLAEAKYLLDNEESYTLEDAGITNAPAGVDMTYTVATKKIEISGAGDGICSIITNMTANAEYKIDPCTS